MYQIHYSFLRCFVTHLGCFVFLFLWLHYFVFVVLVVTIVSVEHCGRFVFCGFVSEFWVIVHALTFAVGKTSDQPVGNLWTRQTGKFVKRAGQIYEI